MNSYLGNRSCRVVGKIARLSHFIVLSVVLALAQTRARAATLIVTNANDSGTGSLRAAIAAATSGDTITFSLASPSTITLTSGRLSISNFITIAGPGPANLAIDGHSNDTVLSIATNAVITGMTITNGHLPVGYSGGGIYDTAPTVTLSNVTVTGNSGGGIGVPLFDQTLQLMDSTISGNLGGGIFQYNGTLQIVNSRIIGNGDSNSFGGGISLIAFALTGPQIPCVLDMTNVTLSGNVASNGGAIYFNQEAAGVFITGFSNVLVSSNRAWLGGGIYATEAADLTMANLRLVDNVASAWGGAIYNDSATFIISNASIIGNSAGGNGGAIAGFSAAGGSPNVTLFNCLVMSNSASGGGAIFQDPHTYAASAQLINSTFAFNRATGSGGAIWNAVGGGSGSVTVVDCTFNGNSAASGGAILSAGAPYQGWQCYPWVRITNSTFSGNSAIMGGAIYNAYAFQPSPSNPEPTNGVSMVQILNSTLTGNTGCSIFNLNAGPGNAVVQIGSSILNAGPFGGTISNNAGTISSLGYNIARDNAGGALTNGTDLINTDPKLGPLQDNGGAVFTQALLPGSPAIDQGYNFSGLASDGRGLGFARTYDYPAIANALSGDGTDIGAFELQPATTDFAT
ncbi:MAG TPA: choice-of-anchor Q domain-containing protein, partial [Verrucomicrobiae bacterium]|nr:choice-of-anchor Q domain-containing protein [Verrucomicrobiae bacterium]